jgi:hypothetical protein
MRFRGAVAENQLPGGFRIKVETLRALFFIEFCGTLDILFISAIIYPALLI